MGKYNFVTNHKIKFFTIQKVEGDNKNNSIDSFDYGPISKGLVLGNPILIVRLFLFSFFE